MTVPCITKSGQVMGSSIPIIDSDQLLFVEGVATLAKAPPSTKAWVGNHPSVTIVYDPNACVAENPFHDGEWQDGGLLIRGAYLNENNELVLQDWVTAQDINLIDVTPEGGFQSDLGDPDDSGLASFPQLTAPIDAAKVGVLAAACASN
jgi:hypothetical protein